MNKNDSFSVRMGIEPAQPVQTDDLTQSARLAFYQFLDVDFVAERNTRPNSYNVDVWIILARQFLSLDHKKTYDSEFGVMTSEFHNKMKDFFHNGKWNLIFDFIEYTHFYLRDISGVTWTLEFHPNSSDMYEIYSQKYHERINSIMERENLGFRFLNGRFCRITNDDELAEITRATNTPYQNANTHISKAIALLSDRENPDYANSIKESISAVEAAAKELTGDNNATLGAALKKLDTSGIKTHPAFNEAMQKLYGFASDAGARHAIKGDPIQQDQPTARYILITCSAFVNYLIANTPAAKK